MSKLTFQVIKIVNKKKKTVAQKMGQSKKRFELLLVPEIRYKDDPTGKYGKEMKQIKYYQLFIVIIFATLDN